MEIQTGLTGRPSLGESSTAVAVSASASSVFGGMADSVERAAAMAGDAGSADGGMELEAPHVDRYVALLLAVCSVLMRPGAAKRAGHVWAGGRCAAVACYGRTPSPSVSQLCVHLTELNGMVLPRNIQRSTDTVLQAVLGPCRDRPRWAT